MKIILDDANPGDAKLMQLLGAVMQRSATTPQPVQNHKVTPAEAAPIPAAKGGPIVEPLAVVPDPEPEEANVPESEESLEVDADGVEWDPELHASTKSKTQDGRWKKRRGAATKTDTPAPAKSADSEAGTVDFETYKEAVKTHKGKFGVDRTREILQSIAGEGVQPSTVPENLRGAVVDALSNDKGADSESGTIDIDDFC